MLQLIFSAMIPAVVMTGAYLLDTKTVFNRLPYWARQMIWGLVFCLFAIFSMKNGVEYGEAIYTIRNSWILLCGIIFGGISGIIAGVGTSLGLIFSPEFSGYYYGYAMIIICILAGLLAMLIRRYLFNNKIPPAHYGIILGLSVESLYLLLALLVRRDDIQSSFHSFMNAMSMDIILNTTTITLALFVVSLITKEKTKGKRRKEKKNLLQMFQKMMLLCVILIFSVAGIYTYVMQSALTKEDTQRRLTLSIQDVKNDVTDAVNEDLIKLTDQVAQTIENDRKWGQEIVESYLLELRDAYEVAEINIVDKEGIILYSSDSVNIGYDMKTGKQSREFMKLLDDKKKEDINGREAFAQSYQPVSNRSNISRKYCAVTLKDGGFIQTGYDMEQFQKDIDSKVSGLTRNKRIDENGFILVCDKDMRIVSSLYDEMNGKTLAQIGLDFQPEKVKEMEQFSSVTAESQEVNMMYSFSEGYYIIAVRMAYEANLSKNMTFIIQIFIEIIVCVAIFFTVFFIIRRYIVKDLEKVNTALEKITEGNLDVEVEAQGNLEFAELSKDINQTVSTLKTYIHEANMRIDKELAVAKQIQYQMLPSDEIVVPDDGQFELTGCMDTAKEVGGDFYDYFPVGDNRVALVIADVSGKGIPAALFMMTAKTLIKNLLLNGKNPAEALETANAELCANNSAKMFVTAWVGIFNYEEDTIVFANAGHNPPLIKKSWESEFSYLDFKKYKRSIMLGIRKNIKYYENEIHFSKDDILYLYTDGVTEATSRQNELFGEERLKKCLDENARLGVKELLESVKREVNLFVGEAEQFDDITMVALKMLSLNRELELEINGENQKEFARFIENIFSQCGIAGKTINQMLICFDEMFSNTMKYSDATIYKLVCGFHKDRVFIQMSDNGMPYNPMEQEIPDVTKPRESYSKGGYGLVLIRKITDKQVYKYQNNRNILTLYKEVKSENESL